METRKLGRSDLVVSRIGLGLAALGRPGYINIGHAADLHGEYDVQLMQERAFAVLDTAWSAGCRYFDAARSYGLAESFLSRWIAAQQINPDAVTVGSKWGYTYAAGWKVEADKHEIKDHTIDTLRRQETESRAILGPFLKLYQVHSVTLDSGVLDNRPVLDELARLRDGGMKIGLSLTGPRQGDTLKRAVDIVIGGSNLFDCVQATWNILEQSAGQALAEAHAAGMGVIVKEAMANGRLADRGAAGPSGFKQDTLAHETERLSTTQDAFALAAVLAQPWADLVLSGAATPEQLCSNLAALAVQWDHQASDAIRTCAEDAAVYWRTRSRLPWN
jgi:aryl-alcohol dehydrogenase-like predicted oxidoreductase